MTFEVVFIGDDVLPEGKDWFLVQRAGMFYAFIRRSMVTPATLAAAWLAFAELVGLVPTRVAA